MKSAIGIGTLLQDGLGDTIQVSLTKPPEEDIDPCRRLANLGMQAAKLEKGVVRLLLRRSTTTILISNGEPVNFPYRRKCVILFLVADCKLITLLVPAKKTAV
ncbi:4-hydroxy-3-methylbut-2-en-1-yl diphosphate synthase (ferredoxin), chloroplastic-like isoform X2 [Cryptomeria japonica]|uniref:4-hydroxy-3-methylbut-2-en-1-yl diphosphate synthase (ferredoxin), chloroplastic-like isoform X2 n=1 Tax=Cryptomeria japonica TaxID=3369 RepID=UPI0027DA3699|nr:4-hydroxy-3-methylbut-2-en-1-yl diphosphate synthase (ferredoxin), chloroplastic-like isoform X2 [Cryptomeria japonica]